MRFAKNTQHGTSKVLRLPRKMTMDTSKVPRLRRKLQLILRKRRKSIALATQNDIRRVINQVWISQSATPATRNGAKPHVKPPKVTPFAELTIGTAIRGSRGRLQTVANGCGRKRNVERTRPQPPDPQSETGTLATHSGKKVAQSPQRPRHRASPSPQRSTVIQGSMAVSSSAAAFSRAACQTAGAPPRR